MNSKVMFSKETDNWSTPKDFYKKLGDEFNFDYDPCPLRSNFNCLIENWYGNVFINPPYSDIRAFLNKGLVELESGNAKLLCYLLPVRTDAAWFHNFIYNKAEVRFVKGRLRFGDAKNDAPFPSMVVIYRK